MDVNSRKRKRARSDSCSRSESRSRSRERHSRSHKKHDKHSYLPRRKHSHSQSKDVYKHQHESRRSNHQSSKSILKTEDDKPNIVGKIKSVQFAANAKDNGKENNEDKQKEDFNVSGALKRDLETTKNGVVLKYNEPPEGTTCDRHWRLYVYKGDEQINLFHLHRQSFYLIGRDHRVTDILCRHISVSSQHAVIQYRRVKIQNTIENAMFAVKPYIMDLQSRHGTYLMGDKLEPYRFYELLPKDKIQFGRSTREYIVLAADSNEKDLAHQSEIALDENASNEAKEELPKYDIWSDDD